MRFEIDEEHRIVDFYIEGKEGWEHREGMELAAAVSFLKDVLTKINEIEKSAEIEDALEDLNNY